MAVFLLVAGLALLALAGDALVRGSVSIAERLHIPPIIIGLTIVAFGTTAPELIVSLEAALKGSPGLALGNVIGSNITNVTLILGLPAMLLPLAMAGRDIRNSILFMIAVSAFVMLEASDLTLDRWTGFRLILLLLAYLAYSGWTARRNPQILDEAVAGKMLSLPVAIALAVAGLAGLAFGGKLTTDGALGVAEAFGLAESAVGLTIVAIGTSLPELATSLAAAIRRQAGVAVGNIIGSNIFNLLGIIGLTALVVPLDVEREFVTVDFWVMLVTSAALLLFVFTTRRIGRLTGLLLTLAYIAYAIVALRHGMAQ
jgi:cation:H+ antiporter